MSTTETLLADFLEQDEAAAELKVSSRTLDRWQKLGEGPPITRLGRRVLYRRSSLLEWLRLREDRRQGDITAREKPRAAPDQFQREDGGPVRTQR